MHRPNLAAEGYTLAAPRKPAATKRAPRKAPAKKKAEPKDHIALIRKAVDDAIFETSVAEAVTMLRQVIADVQPITEFSDALAAEICERMALGETVADIIKAKDMPDEKSIYRWRKSQPEFGQSYARARVDQMHAWADQIVTLADGAEGGFRVVVPVDDDILQRIEKTGMVEFRFNRKHVTEADLQIKTRQWLMARLAPDDFGEKSTVNHHHNFEDKDDAELRAEFRNAAEKAGLSPEEMLAWMQSGGVLQ